MLLTLQLISNPEGISGKNSVSVFDFAVCENAQGIRHQGMQIANDEHWISDK
jgi:hypothetical protein